MSVVLHDTQKHLPRIGNISRDSLATESSLLVFRGYAKEVRFCTVLLMLLMLLQKDMEGSSGRVQYVVSEQCIVITP